MGLTVTENGTEFDRGQAAGQIAARLREHDKHFEKINGSQEKMADATIKLRTDLVAEMGKLNMSIQRMADAMAADRATVLTTAEAVEKERKSTAGALETARANSRDDAERRWSPLARWGVVVGIIVGLVSVIAIVLANLVH